eukprot:3739510-Rhodomonas_salina.1
MSPDAVSMEGVTAAMDREGIRLFLVQWFHTAVEALEGPESAMQTVDTVHGGVRTVLTGFSVTGVVYNATALEWVATVRYVPDSPNTLTSLYVTRSGGPPYRSGVGDTFFVAKHPCMQSASVCCLPTYAEEYFVGDFAGTVSGAVGACGAGVQAQDTATLFDAGNNEALLMGALSELNHSYVTRVSEDTLELHINRFALRDEVSVRTPVAGGYDMEFFVGMTYMTLLSTNALATVASQVRVNARATDAMVFATASQQDYSLLEYISMGLFETKVVVDEVAEHHMQFLKLSVVLPDETRQNMQTGLIPLTSVRFAVAQSLPSVMDTAEWVNPCFSGDGSGLFDNATS